MNRSQGDLSFPTPTPAPAIPDHPPPLTPPSPQDRPGPPPTTPFLPPPKDPSPLTAFSDLNLLSVPRSFPSLPPAAPSTWALPHPPCWPLCTWHSLVTIQALFHPALILFPDLPHELLACIRPHPAWTERALPATPEVLRPPGVQVQPLRDSGMGRAWGVVCRTLAGGGRPSLSPESPLPVAT